MLALALVVALLIAIGVGSVVAPRLGLPAPVLLVGLGSLLSLVPGLTGVRLPPEAVLLIFLPVLLYWESLTTSLREIRRLLRGIILNGTLLVGVTAAAIAVVLHALGVSWGAAWIIGAALGPTDATVVAALGHGLPRRTSVVLQAESLINDGTALVIYALAIGTATGQIDPTPANAAGRLALSFVGGIAVGLVTGWLLFRVRRALHEPALVNLNSLLTPLLAYLLAEEIHASGVLAVVVAGLYMSQVTPGAIAAPARQQGAAFWTFSTFILNGALFVLVGIQLPHSAGELTTDTAGHALVLVAAAYLTMLVARYGFLNLSIAVIRLVDRRPYQRTLRTTHRARVVSTVAGFRGAVSLAVALAVPGSLSDRGLIVFVTGTFVVVSLVLQGVALPRVIRWARLPDDSSVVEELRTARVAATREALEALPELGQAAGAADEVMERLTEEYEEKLAALQESEGDEAQAATRMEQRRGLTLELIARKRATIVRLRDEHTIDDTVLREIQSQLDAEEVRLLGSSSSEGS
ncbi:sodium/proton antiporter, CPA1 family [Raineyella antarctica]|uniref:Sodium/proton antiporter, CPA1 family n=1 Tax=Raineyella antarctica TaxID=1577474 RepID=A0A1G6HLS2_9ACTN|nr:Na+/H+ antiporter [Raineyella antarctica]SDB95103.1 sodium/proton antiporter, CPA1 family [Raineyella antarctica]